MPRGRANRPPDMSRFQPLADYLASRDEGELVLTFAAIEAITGAPLSVSATASPVLWTLTKYAHVRTWVAVGWRAHLEQRDHAVRFTHDEEGEDNE